jgi:hypothetical protein
MKNSIRACLLFLITLAALMHPALARIYLNCSTRKVTIVSTPTENMRSSGEEVLGFWVDDMAKTITFADGVPLTVGRLDDRWITAAQGDMSYEFDRQSGTLTFAASTTKDGITTLIVGSGQCTPAARQGRSQAIPVQVAAKYEAVIRPANFCSTSPCL